MPPHSVCSSSVHIQGPACSLAQDAEAVTRAREILRSAAAASNRHGFDNNTTQDSCGFEARSSVPSSPSSHGDGTDKDEQSSACCSPRQRLELIKGSRIPKHDAFAAEIGVGSATFDNPADALPLLAVAETLGVGNAVDACLDFIATEKEAVVAAAKKRFSSLETCGMISRVPAPTVDWALAVQRLAAWPRSGGDVAVATHVPTPLSSSRGNNETKQPSPPSPSLSQGFECSSQLCGLRRAADDQRGAAAVVERSTQCPDDEAEDDITVHSHRTAMRRRKRVSRRSLRYALESSVRLRSESPQRSPTNSPPSSPAPPPWPRVACVEPTAVACCDDDRARGGRVGVWQERGSGDRLKYVKPCTTANAHYCQRAAHRAAAAPPFLADRSVRRRKDEKVRINSNESDDGVDPQGSVEEDGRDDDRSGLLVEDIPREVQNHEPEGGGGGIEGGNLGERRCCCYVTGDVAHSCCRNDKDSTRAFKRPEASTTRPIFASGPVARISDDDVRPATWRKASVRGGEQSPSHPSERWPSTSFEGDPSSDRHNASEEPWSQRRRRSHSANYYDDDHDGDGRVDAETMLPGPREYNIRPSSGSADVSLGPEDGKEANADDGGQGDVISCALARKRALLRVRLARQRHELATAVVDANERGLRAERRRRREEKLAVLLTSTLRGGGVGVGSGGCGGNRSARGRPLVRDKSHTTESGERNGEYVRVG